MAVSRVRKSPYNYGFTILELMIAVSIVGILSAIAIPQLLNYQLRSRSAEAKTNLGAIRVLETAHFSENDFYVSVPPEPPVVPGSQPAAFDEAAGFADLGFRPEGRVYFSYGVNVTGDGVGFSADAGGDLDADGFVQFWGYAKPDGGGTPAAGRVGCNVAALAAEQIGPCDPAHGSSIF
jgi:type IV pilus assembly protein PilA